MPRRLRNLADGAALLDLPNAEAVSLAAALAAAPPVGFLDAVPGACTLLLLFDPERFDPGRYQSLPIDSLPARPSREVRLPTVYDGADLDQFGLPRDQVVRLHAGAHWTVAFLGFAPGFAYLSGAPAELSVPRLQTPRVRVPAGSVAVAGGYGGVYPAETPGGWRLLGRTAARLFDPASAPPALLRPGDRVVFEPVASLPEIAPLAARAPEGEPVLRVISPGALTSVQGAPRYGLSASGVPAGGAMDLPFLAFANEQVGNPPGAAGLEITLAGPALEVLAPLLAWPGGARQPGEIIRFAGVAAGVREYFCVAGGLFAPDEVTRPLRRGDLLYRKVQAETRPISQPRPAQPPRRSGPTLRAIPGPQLDSFSPGAIEQFFAAEYRVSPHSDRRGVRLLGPALALVRPADLPPEGTAPGAVQVPGDGLPIVLGPDRPVTGGYPKIATVISADLPVLAQARPGTALRFQRATLAEALAARRSP